MKCLITGGAGFIGSNLVDQLIKLNHQVVVIDNLSTGQKSNLSHIIKKIEFVNLDISKELKDIEDFFKDVDWVFHLAGLADIVPSITSPDNYFRANVQGTVNVLEASRNAKIKKFIYAASASCYGIPTEYPTNENCKIDTQYPYALTKNLGEQIVMHWAKIYKMPNVSLRFFNVYGPRSRTTGAYGAVFGVFLAQKLANKPLTIVGDGKQTRDFIHVFDLVNAMIKAAEKAKGSEIFNLGSGKETSVNEIADIISTNQINVPKRPGEPDRSMADINKIKELLNWSPKVSLKEGISMLLSNIDQWKDAPVWTPKSIEEATATWFKYLKK